MKKWIVYSHCITPLFQSLMHSNWKHMEFPIRTSLLKTIKKSQWSNHWVILCFSSNLRHIEYDLKKNHKWSTPALYFQDEGNVFGEVKVSWHIKLGLCKVQSPSLSSVLYTTHSEQLEENSRANHDDHNINILKNNVYYLKQSISLSKHYAF